MRFPTPAAFLVLLVPALVACASDPAPARAAPAGSAPAASPPPPAAPAPSDDCDFTASRSAVVEANGVRGASIVAQAGSLRVEGDPDLDRVRVDGTACASSAELLERIGLTAVREGGEIVVRAEMPRTGGSWLTRGDDEARLDLVVRVPEGMALDVNDGSGSTTIRGVGAVRLEDGSGSARIEAVDGDLEVDDASGGLEVERVAGDVRLEDGSGSIELREIRGSVRLRDGSGSVRLERVGGSVTVDSDGSGSIRAREVRGDVIVRDDGSGSIRVERVGGEFVVEKNGSGGIEFREVAGGVRIPPQS